MIAPERIHLMTVQKDVLTGAAASVKTASVLAPQPGTAQARGAFAYVGSFTSRARNARGNGINVYRIDADSGAFSHVQHVGNLVNPSFLLLSRDRALYSVHGDESYASAFAVDAQSGRLTLLGQADTGGSNGVRQMLDASGRFLIVANYASGSVAVLPVAADGALRDHTMLFELKGPPGPHKLRQTSSHPHDIVLDPSGRFVLVPDLGLDRTFVLRFDPARGVLSEQSVCEGRPCSVRDTRPSTRRVRCCRFSTSSIPPSHLPLGRRARRAAPHPDQLDIGHALHRHQHGGRACSGARRAIRLRVEPRQRRYRRLCGGGRHGHARAAAMGADAGPAPALHRAHAVRPLSLRRQRGQRLDCRLSRRRRERPAHADRTGGADRDAGDGGVFSRGVERF